MRIKALVYIFNKIVLESVQRVWNIHLITFLIIARGVDILSLKF